MQDANQEKDERIVEEVYDIDEDQMHILAEKSAYWKSAEKFYGESKHRKHSDLTDKQQNWLLKIDRALNEENNK